MAVNRILERLDSLISRGEEVLIKRYRSNPDDPYSEIRVDEALFHQWRTSCLAFLNTLPSDYIYSREFKELCSPSSVYNDSQAGVAILRAAKDDIAGGYLQKVEILVSASVFSDFLEMADHLLDNGYKDPAASSVGAVLEDGLRRICISHTVTVKADDNISSLNQKLTQKQVYNPLQQTQIQVWNKLRDYADHGKFEEYSADKVRDMLSGVRNFLASQLN